MGREVRGTELLRYRDAMFDQDPGRLAEVVNYALDRFKWSPEARREFLAQVKAD